MIKTLKKFLLIAGVSALPFTLAMAQVDITVNLAPPPLPIYEQPPCPEEGFLWTPGYWAYADDAYYWVPGEWVAPPRPRLLWTPGYWGYENDVYVFHTGYWGPQVGFYGGIDYGFGYRGDGYVGGRWEGDRFQYNTEVTRVNTTVIRNVYVDKTVIRDRGPREDRVSFNGGPKGIKAEPTEAQRRIDREDRIQPTAAQVERRQEASRDKAQFVGPGHDRPASLAGKGPGGPKPPGAPKPEGREEGEDPKPKVGAPDQRPDKKDGGIKDEQDHPRLEDGRKPGEKIPGKGERPKPDDGPGIRGEKPRPEAGPDTREERPKPEGGLREEKPRPEAGQRGEKPPRPEVEPREEKPRLEAAPREERPRPEVAPREERPRPEAAPREEKPRPEEGDKREEPKKK